MFARRSAFPFVRMAFLTSIGLGFLRVIAILLPFAVGGYVGEIMARRGVRTWLCWVVGLSTFALLGAMFWPAGDRLQSAICRGSDDYQGCMEDTGPDDWM
jgi:hypothetical protein